MPRLTAMTAARLLERCVGGRRWWRGGRSCMRAKIIEQDACASRHHEERSSSISADGAAQRAYRARRQTRVVRGVTKSGAQISGLEKKKKEEKYHQRGKRKITDKLANVDI